MSAKPSPVADNGPSGFLAARRSFRKNYDLYLMSLPVVAYFVIFAYIPMYGVQIAFKDFNPVQGILGSPWVGLQHFYRFYNSFYFWRLIKNTVGISLYALAVTIPAPIILALIFNGVRQRKVAVVCETLSYAPNFLSTVIVAGMILIFLSPGNGLIPAVLRALGIPQPTSIIAEPSLFWHIYVWSRVWQGVGWNSLIYTAAISGIPVELYEAAIVDGAGRWQRIWKITLPGIAPTIVIVSILAFGGVMNLGFEKIYLLQNPINLQASEIISTYVYKAGILDAQYSFSSMVGLFNNVINFILLALVNWLARRLGDTSLW